MASAIPAVIGAGASIFGAKKASSAANAGNAMAAGSGGMTAQQAQQAQAAQAPYQMMGYGAMSPYQMLLTGQAPTVDWDVQADEARYQQLNDMQFELQRQYDSAMGPGQMRSHYRSARKAQEAGLVAQKQLNELRDLEQRRTQYEYAQSTPSQSAIMEKGGYTEGWDQEYTDRANQFYQQMQERSSALPMEITDYERGTRQESLNRQLAQQGMLNSRTATNLMGDLESQLAEKQYGRMVDSYNRDYGSGTDWQNRLYGINTDDFNRYTGVRANELGQYYNLMNLGRGAASSAGSFGIQAGQAQGNAMMGAAQGITAAGQQSGMNYANIGAMPMNALNAYNQSQQYNQQPYHQQPTYSNIGGYQVASSNPFMSSSNPLGLTAGQGL